MEIKELRAALKRIEDLYAAAGAAVAAKDLRSIAQLLDGHDGKSVDAFITETRELLSSPTAAKATAPDMNCVTLHAKRLLAAGIDQIAFDAAIGDVDADKAVKKPEWAAIANRYLNAPTQGKHVYKFKTNMEARAAIRDAFIERHEANSKRGILDGLTKWAS